MSKPEKPKKKGGESRDIAQKQKEVSTQVTILICQAHEKFREGERIMNKEFKTVNELDKAAQLFSEAITLLYNFCNYSIDFQAKYQST